MTQRRKDPVLVVVQLSGGNDFMNTLIPYTDPVYHDARPVVGIAQQDVLTMDGTLGFHPSAGPLKELYDQGDVAIVQGVGYPEATRSHFREHGHLAYLRCGQCRELGMAREGHS